MSEYIQIVGYHGTDLTDVKSIVDVGYKTSKGDEQWFGDGVYFFIKGLNLYPIKQAENWAKLSAYDKFVKVNKYNQWGVVKSEIDVREDTLFDLNDPIQRAYLDNLYKYVYRAIQRKLPYGEALRDGMVINYARDHGLLDADVVIGNVYIKLSKDARIYHFDSRLPNCTICAVADIKLIKESVLISKGKV